MLYPYSDCLLLIPTILLCILLGPANHAYYVYYNRTQAKKLSQFLTFASFSGKVSGRDISCAYYRLGTCTCKVS